MSAFAGDGNRQLVPRWRPWDLTASLGEGKSARVHRQDLPSFDSEAAKARFRNRPNVGRATELLASALAFGYEDELITELANFYRSGSRPIIGELATHVRDRSEPELQGAMRASPESPVQEIVRLKSVLSRHPRNGLRWADLARAYIVLAQTEKAERAIKVALALAPNDRFVLRCAAAMFVHVGAFDTAHHVLETAPNLISDPWLLAPYVAVCDLGEIKLRHHRDAARLVDDDNISFRNRAELLAALGTLNLNAGGERRGRQLLRRSAIEPTENSLAQIEWMSARLRSRLVDVSPTNVPRDFEAQARRFHYIGKWEDAVTSSKLWLLDQPFSAEAAQFGSFCAWVAEDWTSTCEIAALGLSANPNDAMLMNNMALACIEVNEYSQAVKLLAKCRRLDTSSSETAVLCATEGLLFFRLWKSEEGRRRYESAIAFFEKRKMESSAAIAALMLVREDIQLNEPVVGEDMRRAMDLIGERPPEHVLTLTERVARLEAAPVPNRIEAPIVQSMSIVLADLAEPIRFDMMSVNNLGASHTSDASVSVTHHDNRSAV